jgi:hypothetical protein
MPSKDSVFRGGKDKHGSKAGVIGRQKGLGELLTEGLVAGLSTAGRRRGCDGLVQHSEGRWSRSLYTATSSARCRTALRRSMAARSLVSARRRQHRDEASPNDGLRDDLLGTGFIEQQPWFLSMQPSLCAVWRSTSAARGRRCPWGRRRRAPQRRSKVSSWLQGGADATWSGTPLVRDVAWPSSGLPGASS